MKLISYKVVHISQILKIECLCGRIDSMHVNGDGVMLTRAFVYIQSKTVSAFG